MPGNELEARLRLLESEVRSDIAVRLALVESAVDTEKGRGLAAAAALGEADLGTRMAVTEERIKTLTRFFWVVLAAVLAGAVTTNVQLLLIRSGR